MVSSSLVFVIPASLESSLSLERYSVGGLMDSEVASETIVVYFSKSLLKGVTS
jgi:hypothetical protein